MKKVQLNRIQCSVQTLTPLPSTFIDQIIIDQEDKNSTQNNKIINTNNTNISPLTITIDNKKIVSSTSTERPFSYESSITCKCFLLILMLLLIGFGILIVTIVTSVKQTNELNATIEKKNEIIKEEGRKIGEITRLILFKLY